jgi:hypothetical protein
VMWGDGSSYCLGDGSVSEACTPHLLKKLQRKGAFSISCGADHVVCCVGAGAVYSWGVGTCGRLGQGNERDYSVPTKIQSLKGSSMIQVACGKSHCAALSSSGGVWTWGDNQHLQCGVSHTGMVLAPQALQVGPRIRKAAAMIISCTVQQHMLHQRSSTMIPQQQPDTLQLFCNISIAHIACGKSHTVAVSRGGAVFTWGKAKYGACFTTIAVLLPSHTFSLSHTLTHTHTRTHAHTHTQTHTHTHTPSLTHPSTHHPAGALGNGCLDDSSTPCWLDDAVMRRRAVVSAAAGAGFTVVATIAGEVSFLLIFQRFRLLANYYHISAIFPAQLQHHRIYSCFAGNCLGLWQVRQQRQWLSF